MDRQAETSAAPSPDPAYAPTPQELSQGLVFNHVVEMQTKQRLTEVAASVGALLETLVSQGLLPLEEYERRRQATFAREIDRVRSQALVVLGEEPDKYALQDLPQIDCEERLPLCKARCCTLMFPLSAQDLDEGVVRWDYSRPYQIRHREDGYCVHNDEHKGCSVYASRPAVCRRYDCRNDTRVWSDFEKRIPAP